MSAFKVVYGGQEHLSRVERVLEQVLLHDAAQRASLYASVTLNEKKNVFL